MTTDPPSERITVRRGPHRATYERETLLAVLDAGLVAHVGVTTPHGPIVLPMAYGRTDSHLLLHGAAANDLLRSADGHDVCATVTLVDGLVLARSPFHNSMNYRSVVVRGRARRIDRPEAKRDALRVITDHVVATWATGRPPTDAEVRRTLVLEVPLTEMSGKIRSGDPVDEADDVAGPWWAGTVPIVSRFGAPASAADLGSDATAPVAVSSLHDEAVSPVPVRG